MRFTGEVDRVENRVSIRIVVAVRRIPLTGIPCLLVASHGRSEMPVVTLVAILQRTSPDTFSVQSLSWEHVFVNSDFCMNRRVDVELVDSDCQGHTCFR